MILALETAGSTARLWLIPEPKVGRSRPAVEWDSGRRLTDELHSKIMRMLSDHKLEFNDLTGLIIFSGPGSFTALRIGHSVANALADSLGIPVVGALGDDWLESGIWQLGHSVLRKPALPEYGSAAHITRPQA